MRRAAAFILVLCSSVFVDSTGLRAAWVSNGIPVGAATYGQSYPKAVSDGAGGAIITWADGRSTSPGAGIYAQRVDGYGNVLWTVNGVALRADVFALYRGPEIASDGAGGAIVVWSDNRGGGDYDLYAQRVDANGTVQWPSASVTISDASTDQLNYRMISDGTGGAVIAWQDSSSGSADIYAQRIDASGAAQWTAGGVPICTNMFEQHMPRLATDRLGGAIIVWDDHRGGPSDIYAQRINASGTVVWAANGMVVCNAVNAQQEQCIVSDDAGGVIIAWRDYRNSANWLIYAARINSSGTLPWTSNGVPVNTTVVTMYQVSIASDGWNGAIIAWAQTGTGGQDIYSQRMSYLGTRQWNAGGNVVCSATGTQSNPVAVPDGDRGAVIVWDDYRPGTQRDIYAQRLSSDGAPVWTSNGIAACVDLSDQVRPSIVTDGAGGGIIAWEDGRLGSPPDVYAQRVERFGHAGYPCPTITSVADVPSDQGGHVTVAWNKSVLDIAMAVIIDQYSLWRMLPMAQLEALLAAGEKGADPAKLAGAAPGTIYISKALGGATGWELLSYVNATASPTYSTDAATLYDSTAADPGLHHFMVMAHGTDHFVFWQSEPDSGCSIDNLAPAVPVQLSAEQSFDPVGLILSWQSGIVGAPSDPDFSHFALYRGTSRDFIPGPGNLIYAGPDTTYFDGEWRWNGGFFYKLCAVDVHGNASPCNVLTPDDVTGTETPRIPEATYLAQNAPNPFNPSTTIPFGLAANARVTLSIFDVSGRLIRRLVDETRNAGLYREIWDGRNAGGAAVSSGVYFYHLRAGMFSDTKKMVLTR